MIRFPAWLAETAGTHRPAIAFICVTGFLDALGMGLVGPVLPRLIEGFTGSNASAGAWNGVLAALWAGMQFLCSPAIGVLSDRFGRRAVIVLSTAGLAANWVLMALAPNLWWLALGRVLGGLTSSTFTAIYAYMADITALEKRAGAYGVVGAAFSAGFVAGPALGGLLGSLGPRAPFWVAAGLSTLACLYGLWVLPESLPPEKRTAFSWRRANPVGAMSLLVSRPGLVKLVLVGMLAEFAQYAYWILFVLYAQQRYGWRPMTVGIALAAGAGLDIVVQGWLVGRISAWLGDKRTMVLGLLGGVLGFTALGLAPTAGWFVVALGLESLLGLAPARAAGSADRAGFGARTGFDPGGGIQRREPVGGGLAAGFRTALCAYGTRAARGPVSLPPPGSCWRRRGSGWRCERLNRRMKGKPSPDLAA